MVNSPSLSTHHRFESSNYTPCHFRKFDEKCCIATLKFYSFRAILWWLLLAHAFVNLIFFLITARAVSCPLHISRFDVPIVPQCCRLGQCEWVPDSASAVGASLGDVGRPSRGRWPILNMSADREPNAYNATVFQREL